MDDNMLRFKLAETSDMSQKVFMSQLEAYENLNTEELLGILKKFSEYQERLASNPFSESTIENIIKKSMLNIETQKEWSQLDEKTKLDPNEIRVLMDSIKSMRDNAQALKSMRRLIEATMFLLNEYGDDLEIVISALAEE